MAEAKQTFQFTLSPVQGFVSQARRTRDFWAGSFILSWLSSAAIASIQKQKGDIQFPVPDAGYLRHLYGEATAHDAYPQQGSIPNRFMAVTAQVPGDFHPEWVTQGVQAAWEALSAIVWDNDLADLAGAATRTIWKRQVGSFWEMSWVMAEEGSAANLLDRRKNWRDTVAPSEPGHKCMMMDGWQELSGIEHTRLADVRQFWDWLVRSGKPGMATDLSEGEQLSAMAFIKRRFARYFADVKVTLPGNLGQIFGWPLPSAVPSVSFVAAAPWLAQVLQEAPIEALRDWNQAASAIASYSELAHVQGKDKPFEIDICCVREAAEKRKSEGLLRRWAGLDGQLYFPSALENPRLFPDQEAARQVLRQLGKLRDAAGGLDLPSPYYAILLMDGDQLGKHMGDKDKQIPISAALNQFTNGAGDIVRQHNGFLIYAGGDDVLALLPMDDALDAAAALQASYKNAFAKHSPAGKRIDSTLSGAIEFVHIRTPLTRVLKDAHQLLDDVAKEHTGRNAIAVRVWKPSGLALQWAMPWEKALDEQGQVRISQVARIFAQQHPGAEGQQFSNKFFFRMQELLKHFSIGVGQQDVLEKLILAEYLHSYDQPGQRAAPGSPAMAELQQHLHSLLEQCRCWQRPAAGEKAQLNATQPLHADGALLVRFLAQKGLERE